jgi:hypothetical protein
MAKKKKSTAKDLLKLAAETSGSGALLYPYIPLAHQSPTISEKKRKDDLIEDTRTLFIELKRNRIINNSMEEFQSHFFSDIETKGKIIWCSSHTSLVYLFTYMNAQDIISDNDFIDTRLIIKEHFFDKKGGSFKDDSIRSTKSRLTSNRTKKTIQGENVSLRNQRIKEIVDRVFM